MAPAPTAENRSRPAVVSVLLPLVISSASQTARTRGKRGRRAIRARIDRNREKMAETHGKEDSARPALQVAPVFTAAGTVVVEDTVAGIAAAAAEAGFAVAVTVHPVVAPTPRRSGAHRPSSMSVRDRSGKEYSRNRRHA